MSNLAKSLALGSALTALCVAPPASAGSILAGLTRAECGTTNEIPFEVVFEQALVANGVVLTQSQRNAEQAHQWNDFMLSVMHPGASDDPYKNAATPTVESRTSLHAAILALVTGVDRPDPGKAYVARVDNGAYGPLPSDPASQEEPIRRRVQDFLLHQSQFHFRCATSDQQVAANPSAPGSDTSTGHAGGGSGGGAGGRQSNTPTQRVIIAQDLDGAQKAFPSRNFATFSGKRDEQAGTESYSVQGVALFPGFMSLNAYHQGDMDWALRPYIGVSRTQNGDPKKEVNDFTFGLLGNFVVDGPARSFWPAENYISLTGSWVTDDSHESSLTHAEIDYRPSWGGRFHDDRANLCFLSVRCDWNVLLMADFAEVGDPTGKPSLANVHQYARLGYDFNGDLYLDTATGVWSFSTAYQLRDSFTQDNGDAQLFTAGVAFQPSNASSVKIGINYVRGEALVSLEEQEYWAFSLGFRR